MNAPVSALRARHELLSGANDPGWAAGMRLAFLHIPKTAGTAFGAALSQHFAEAEIAGTAHMMLPNGAADPALGHLARRFRALGLGSHLDQDTLDAIEAGLPAGERLFTVTVLRDPRARLISQYRHWRRAADSSVQAMEPLVRGAFLAARELSLGEFLQARLPHVVKHFRNLQARMICGLSSAELLEDDALLEAARSRLAQIDVVGTTDALEDALAQIATAYGWMPPDIVRPLNVAPGEAPGALAPEVEALIEEYIAVDRALWETAQSLPTAIAPRHRPRNYHRPHAAAVATLLDEGRTRFTMAEALDGHGWHMREGQGANLSRWTGPGRRASIRLKAPQSRQVQLSLHLVSVLDWQMVDGIALTLDGAQPSAPPLLLHSRPHPMLTVDFDLPDTGDGWRNLVIEVPFTRSHQEVDPALGDSRQKGLAIGEITLAARQAGQGPATLGELFWPGEAWDETPPAELVDLLPHHPPQAEPPPAERNLSLDLPLLRGLLDWLAPEHVWAAAGQGFLIELERGSPLAQPRPAGRLALLATLFEMPGRGAAIAELAGRYEDAVLLLPCAEDFRLREVTANPLLAPYLHMVGCTNGILVVNLAAMRRQGGAGRVETFLLLLERIAATTPEKLAHLRPEVGADYALRQLAATLEGVKALAGQAAANAKPKLATLMLEEAPPSAMPATLLDWLRPLLQHKAGPLALVDPDLSSRLLLLLEQLAVAEQPESVFHLALAAQERAFRIASLLAGWSRFGLADNRTAQLALRLATAAARPPLYPKPAKPFAEYIDFYRAEARGMAAHPSGPDLVITLDTMRGGLDHVTRLNQAAREVELALRLLGDRFPGEEILWVDAGCSYGVIMNAVRPPANIAGRCSFLGFDFNAPGIETARLVARNLGNAHCHYAVGDVAEARALAGGRRIHLITAFEVLEHCPDPLAVLTAYREMAPGMLVVGSPMSELQAIYPAEQHLWAFDAQGFAAMAEEAGFHVVGLNQRSVGRFVGGHDWVMVTATTGDPRDLHMV